MAHQQQEPLRAFAATQLATVLVCRSVIDGVIWPCTLPLIMLVSTAEQRVAH